jgi:hypothetical protein
VRAKNRRVAVNIATKESSCEAKRNTDRATGAPASARKRAATRGLKQKLWELDK